MLLSQRKRDSCLYFCLFRNSERIKCDSILLNDNSNNNIGVFVKILYFNLKNHIFNPHFRNKSTIKHDNTTF